jgi:hypothetical protein
MSVVDRSRILLETRHFERQGETHRHERSIALDQVVKVRVLAPQPRKARLGGVLLAANASPGCLLRGTLELGKGVGVGCFSHPQVEVELERLNLRLDGREKRRRGAGCSCSARPSLGRGCVAAIECWPRGWGCGFHTLTNASFNSYR